MLSFYTERLCEIKPQLEVACKNVSDSRRCIAFVCTEILRSKCELAQTDSNPI